MTNTKTNIQPHKKLGFTTDETAKMIVELNRVLINYHIHYQKLRNFHWNVDGSDFFELHKEFEKDYNRINEEIDIAAERIRVFGVKPNFTLKKILQYAEIKEVEDQFSSYEMVQEILSDYSTIHGILLDAINISLEIGDTVTEQIMTDFTKNLEDRHWMYTAWSKK